MQLNIGHLNEDGTYNGQFTTFALAGKVRAQVRDLVAEGSWRAGAAGRLVGGPPGHAGIWMWVGRQQANSSNSNIWCTRDTLRQQPIDSSGRSGRLADGGCRLHSSVLSAAGSWRHDAGCLPATAAGVDRSAGKPDQLQHQHQHQQQRVFCVRVALRALASGFSPQCGWRLLPDPQHTSRVWCVHVSIVHVSAHGAVAHRHCAMTHAQWLRLRRQV